jgi:hypothetical protein
VSDKRVLKSPRRASSNAGYPAVRLLLSPAHACFASACWLGDPFESTAPGVSHTARLMCPLNVTPNAGRAVLTVPARTADDDAR